MTSRMSLTSGRSKPAADAAQVQRLARGAGRAGIDPLHRETAVVRNTALYDILEAFTTDAAGQLASETANGAEIPFEIVENESRPGRTALYC